MSIISSISSPLITQSNELLGQFQQTATSDYGRRSRSVIDPGSYPTGH